MKVVLVVAGARRAGQEVPVSVSPFLIGRASECHLRPASAFVSHRHCALSVRGDEVRVRDFGSTNGTFVNGTRIQDEAPLHEGDRLQVGPLLFDVRVRAHLAVDMPTPLPPGERAPPAPDVEDVAAAFFCDDSAAAPPAPAVDAAGAPTGDTAVIEPPPAVPKPPQADPGTAPPPQDLSPAARASPRRYRRPHTP
jgi:predicted component of type VI protein secretion system